MPENWSWPASTLIRVIDGDTFVAALPRMLTIEIPQQDLGFHGTIGPVTMSAPFAFPQKLRIDGTNAPKVSTPNGKTSAAALLGLLIVGPIDIVTTGPYKYGDEWMAKVTLPSGDDVAQTMIARGHSVAWDGKGARPADS